MVFVWIICVKLSRCRSEYILWMFLCLLMRVFVVWMDVEKAKGRVFPSVAKARLLATTRLKGGLLYIYIMCRVDYIYTANVCS